VSPLWLCFVLFSWNLVYLSISYNLYSCIRSCYFSVLFRFNCLLPLSKRVWSSRDLADNVNYHVIVSCNLVLIDEMPLKFEVLWDSVASLQCSTQLDINELMEPSNIIKAKEKFLLRVAMCPISIETGISICFFICKSWRNLALNGKGELINFMWILTYCTYASWKSNPC